MDMNFKTRDQYVLWRAEWRDQYSKISRDIRSYKHRIARDFKDGHMPSMMQAVCAMYQKQAREMMELRGEAKKICEAQYIERLALAA